MQAEVYYIGKVPVGQLAIMPRPRGGDWLAGEVASFKTQKLDVVVSLIEDAEREELDLVDEQTLCEESQLRFISFPIPDRNVPENFEDFAELIFSIRDLLQQGKNVGIHCRLGIGRSSLTAACVLVTLGVLLEQAWLNIALARRLPVPDTLEQRGYARHWAAHFARSPRSMPPQP